MEHNKDDIYSGDTDSSTKQTVGTALIVYGSVQAEAADGAMRTVQPNSQILINDRIITGSNGMISIVFNDAANTQLDLGRMSDVLITEELLFSGEENIEEVTAEVREIQEALVVGDIERFEELQETAAGGGTVATSAGGRQLVNFGLTADETTPASGAETRGIPFEFLREEKEDPELVEAPVTIPESATEPEPVPAPGSDITSPAIPDPVPPAPPTIPTAGSFVTVLREANLADGTDPDTGLLNENGQLFYSGTLIDLGVDFGGNGPGSIVFGNQSLLIDGTGNDSISIPGDHGTLVINDDGTWTYTLGDNISHPNSEGVEADDILPDSFTFTVINAEGNSAEGSLTVSVYDDGPIVEGQALGGTVNEDGLSFEAGDNSEGLGAGETTITYDLASLVTSGADSPLTFGLKPVADGFDTGLSSQGEAVTYSTDGQVLTASTGAGIIFTLTIDPDTGLAVLDLNDQLDHSGLGDDELLSFTNLGQFVTVTDTDGDAADFSGLISVTVENDVPEITGTLDTETVVEDGLSADLGDQSDGLGGGVTQVQFNLASAVSSGGDEELSYSLLDPGDFATGLTSGGQDVRYSVSDTTLTAATTDNTVFTFTVDPTSGVATLNMDDQLDHTGAGDDELLTISNLGQFIQATDTDGDSVTFAGLINIQVENDVPEITGALTTETVAEDGLSSGLGDFSDGVGGGVTEVQFNLGDAVSAGADEALSYTLLDPSGFATGLTAKGLAVTYSVSGNTLTAATADNTVFTFSVNPNTGVATFNLDDQLDHGGAGENELLTIANLGQFIQAADADGDAVTLDGLINVQVENDVPEITGTLATETVVEDGLSSGLGDFSDGVGGGVTEVQFNLGSAVSAGADEALNYTLLDPTGFTTGLTSKGLAVTYSVSGNTLTAATADNTVFTFSVDPATGIATFNLDDQLDHTGAGDDELLTISNLGQFIQATDTDGDAVTLNGLISVQVENDVPGIIGTLAVETVVEDGLNSNTGDFSDGLGGGATEVQFDLASSLSSGADEPFGYELVDVPASFDSGLTSKGQAVTYSVSGNILTAATAANAVFTFTVDPTTGIASFNLLDQLDHQGLGDAETLTISNLGQFIEALDADGDLVNFDGQINVLVENDVPEITGTVATETVVEDGLSGSLGDFSEGLGGGATTAQLDLAAAVTSGADEELVFSLLDSGDLDTGLTSKGQAVTYSVSGNTLTAATTDNTVFTFSVDPTTGVATFNLDDQLDHTGAGDGELLTISNLGQFVLATDEDGDTVNFNGLINVQVENDVPEIVGTLATATVVEDGLDSNLGDFSDGIGSGVTEVQFNLATVLTSGADEELSYALLDPTGFATGLTSKGLVVSYSVSGNTLTASTADNTVFTFSVDPTTGVATFNLDDQLDHIGTGDSELLIIANLGQFVQAIDADGDAVSFDGLLNIQVENDVPEITGSLATETVVEDGLSAGLGDFSDGVGGGVTEVQFNLGDAVSSGADEELSYALLDPTGFATGLTSKGLAVTYSVSGNTLTAATAASTVFTFTVDPTTGVATFNLDDQLDHTGTGDSELLTIANLGQFIQATDTDGDAVSFDGLINVQVENDVPEITGSLATETVMEDGLSAGIGDFSDGIGGGITEVQFNLGDAVSAGADEELSYVLLDPTGFATGLTSKGLAVTYSVSGNTLTAATADNTVFTFTVDPTTGVATFNLDDQLDHAGTGDSELLTIANLGQFIQATDTDGDTVTLDGLLSVQVENDVPEITGTVDTETVFEDGLSPAAGNLSFGIGGGATEVQLDLAQAVSSGADEELVFSLVAPPDSFDTGLSSRNIPVTYSVSGNTLTASAGLAVVFTFAIDPATGLATFSLNDQLDHQGLGDSELLSIANLGQFVRATDEDGDAVDFTGVLEVQVENDVPELLLTPRSGTVFEDALMEPDDNSTGIGGGTTEVGFNLELLLGAGADEPPIFTFIEPPEDFDTGLTSNQVEVTYGVSGEVLTASAGGTTIFTLTLNPITGITTFKLSAQLDHTGGGDSEILSITNLGQFIQATDLDGDSVDFAGLLTINVENDVPELGQPQDSIMVNEVGNSVTASLDTIGFGADSPSVLAITFTEGDAVLSIGGTNLTSNDAPLYWYDNGDGSWAAVTRDAGGDLDPANTIFTVSLDPVNETYTVDQTGILDGASQAIDVELSRALSGGNTYEAIFGSDATVTTNGDITTFSDGVFLWARSSVDQDDPFAWSGTTDTWVVDTATVNYSTQGVGVSRGASVEGTGVDAATRESEILSMKFFTEAQIDTSGNNQEAVRLNELNSTTLNLSAATFTIDHLGAAETLYYTLWHEGEQVSAEYSLTGLDAGTGSSADSKDDLLVIDSSQLNAGETVFDEIRFEAGGARGGDFRIQSVDVEIFVDGVDNTILVPFEITDADGDTAQSDFSVTFDAGGPVETAAADAADGDVSTTGMVIQGGTGNDTIIGSDYDDTIIGGEGNDSIDGGAGDDVILGNAGNDILVGNIGDDLIDGGAGTDDISGGDDNDVIYGGSGDDQITGDSGQDQLVGGEGVDIISGGEGEDILVGDSVDTATPVTGSSDIVEDGATDQLTGDGGTDTYGDKNTNDTITDAGVGETTEEDLDNLVPPPDPV